MVHKPVLWVKKWREGEEGEVGCAIGHLLSRNSLIVRRTVKGNLSLLLSPFSYCRQTTTPKLNAVEAWVVSVWIPGSQSTTATWVWFRLARCVY